MKKHSVTKIRMYDRDDLCFLCGRPASEMHHVFHGYGNRELADMYGLVVPLCHKCHNEPPYGVHYDWQMDTYLKEEGQYAFEKVYGHRKFMAVFGRNYLNKEKWHEVD